MSSTAFSGIPRASAFSVAGLGPTVTESTCPVPTAGIISDVLGNGISPGSMPCSRK